MSSQIAYHNAPSEERITAKVGPNCKNIKCIKAWNCILGCTWINVLCTVVFPYISLGLNDTHICFSTTEDCIAKLYQLLQKWRMLWRLPFFHVPPPLLWPEWGSASSCGPKPLCGCGAGLSWPPGPGNHALTSRGPERGQMAQHHTENHVAAT